MIRAVPVGTMGRVHLRARRLPPVNALAEPSERAQRRTPESTPIRSLLSVKAATLRHASKSPSQTAPAGRPAAPRLRSPGTKRRPALKGSTMTPIAPASDLAVQRPYCNARRYAGKAMWLLRRLGKGLVEDPTQNLRPTQHRNRPPHGSIGAAIPAAKERIGVCHRVRHRPEVHRCRDVQLRRRTCRRILYHLIHNWLRLRLVRQCVLE